MSKGLRDAELFISVAAPFGLVVSPVLLGLTIYRVWEAYSKGEPSEWLGSQPIYLTVLSFVAFFMCFFICKIKFGWFQGKSKRNRK